MPQNDFQVPAETELTPTGGRIGDLAAMLRVMTPLNGSLPDPAEGRRQLLADLCRFIGVKVGALPPGAPGMGPNTSEQVSASSSSKPADTQGPAVAEAGIGELSPRQEQTLGYLLAGDSEKQVARKLQLSQHTVHVYVKALYRRFGVSSRAELLALHLKK